jgi:hypothetical protein
LRNGVNESSPYTSYDHRNSSLTKIDPNDKLATHSTDGASGVEPLPLASGEGSFEDMISKSKKKKSKS